LTESYSEVTKERGKVSKVQVVRSGSKREKLFDKFRETRSKRLAAKRSQGKRKKLNNNKTRGGVVSGTEGGGERGSKWFKFQKNRNLSRKGFDLGEPRSLQQFSSVGKEEEKGARVIAP